MVKILIGNLTTKIVGFLPDNVQDELDDVLSYRLKDAHYMKKVKEKKWDGIYHLYKRSYGQSFYSGLLSLAEEVLKKNNVEYTRVDERIKPAQNMLDLKFIQSPYYEERPYQQFTVERAIKSTRGILKIATGGGKTVTAIRIIAEIKTGPFMFYTLTKDLMTQAHKELSSLLNEPIGKIGGGEFEIKNINVCMVQTAIMAVNLNNKEFKISDYKFDDEDIEWDEDQVDSTERLQTLKELIIRTKGFIIDECHHTSCKSIKDIIATSVNAYWKYGLSATPFREDGAEIMIQAMFGKKIVDISATYLINNKYLIEPYIIFDPIKNDTKLNSYQAIYKTCISSNESFNIHVADIANHMIASGLSVLVLVQHYPQGEMLKKLIPNTEFLTGKMKGEKREQVLNELKERTKLCLIATSLADEGLDVPTLDAVLLAGGGASSTRVHQRIGRTLRIDRRSANPRDRSIVVYFEHHGAKYLDKHAKKARRIIKTEPAFHIIDSAGPTYVKQEIDEIMGDRSENKINL